MRIVRAIVAVCDEVRAPAPLPLAAPVKARRGVEPPVEPVDVRVGAPVLEVLDQRIDDQWVGQVRVAVRHDEPQAIARDAHPHGNRPVVGVPRKRGIHDAEPMSSADDLRAAAALLEQRAMRQFDAERMDLGAFDGAKRGRDLDRVRRFRHGERQHARAYASAMRGALPGPLRAELEAEGLIHIEERVRGALSLRSFRAPWKYASREYRGFLRFTIALTNTRLLVYGWRGRNVDVGWADPRIAGLELSVDKKRGRLAIAVDVGRFHPDWSGSMTIHLRCEEPGTTMRMIEQLRRRGSPNAAV